MDGASTSSKRPRKKGCGRRKIEIKKIEDQRKRWVTFSKRKKGLLKKATELSKLSGEQIGVLIISEQGRVYTSDNADSVFRQFQSIVKDDNQDEIDDDGDDIQIQNGGFDEGNQLVGIEKINDGEASSEKADECGENKGKNPLNIDLNKAFDEMSD